MSWSKCAAVVVVICIVSCFEVLASDRLLTVDGEYSSGTREAVEALENYGCRVKFVFPPHFIVADIPDHVEAELVKVSSISSVHVGELDPGDFAKYGESSRHTINVWNNVFVGKAHEVEFEADALRGGQPLVNDVRFMDRSMLPLKPPGSMYYDISEFMLGSVAVAVFLPESDGSIDPNLEDWNQTERDSVASEVVNGLNWWIGKGNWRPLTFYTVFHYGVPTGYEPISRPSYDDYLWVPDCLEAIGYTGGNAYYDYANDLRDSLDTDWSTLCFVVDSSNDADHYFSDGWFAYAYYGGPYMVMTYGNDDWGVSELDGTTAHELGHIFYAMDEYYDAGVGCTQHCGYLDVENQNSEYPGGAGGCASNAVFCIMRSVYISMARVCNFTKGQVGWWDTDGDSIPDILDTYPETQLYEYLPDPSTTPTPTYAGSASITALPNQNPWGDGHDITLNYIAKVEYRVDGGGWNDCLPVDGAWGDDPTEAYSFTTDLLSEGMHVIETRAFHTYGNYDMSYAVDSLTISAEAGISSEMVVESMYLEAHPNPFGPRVEVRYSVPGEYGHGVPVSMWVYDIRGRQVTSLIGRIESPGPRETSWDGTYSDGSLAPSGIYFIELEVGEERAAKKLVLTR